MLQCLLVPNILSASYCAYFTLTQKLLNLLPYKLLNTDNIISITITIVKWIKCTKVGRSVHSNYSNHSSSTAAPITFDVVSNKADYTAARVMLHC